MYVLSISYRQYITYNGIESIPVTTFITAGCITSDCSGATCIDLRCTNCTGYPLLYAYGLAGALGLSEILWGSRVVLSIYTECWYIFTT